MKNVPILLTNYVRIDSIYKFSYIVGIICILMFFINILYIKEILLTLNVYKKIKWKFFFRIFYLFIILIVSIVLIYLAIKCFLI